MDNSEPGRREEPTTWERFEQFAKRLLAVPASEIREKQAEERQAKQEGANGAPIPPGRS